MGKTLYILGLGAHEMRVQNLCKSRIDFWTWFDFIFIFLIYVAVIMVKQLCG